MPRSLHIHIQQGVVQTCIMLFQHILRALRKFVSFPWLCVRIHRSVHHFSSALGFGQKMAVNISIKKGFFSFKWTVFRLGWSGWGQPCLFYIIFYNLLREGKGRTVGEGCRETEGWLQITDVCLFACLFVCLFVCVAGHCFEHGHYMASNNPFLDTTENAGLLFVSSELQVSFHSYSYGWSTIRPLVSERIERQTDFSFIQTFIQTANVSQFGYTDSQTDKHSQTRFRKRQAGAMW